MHIDVNSGLSDKVGEAMASILSGLPIGASILILCAFTAFFTEFASNTATANIVVPMLIEAGKALCINPVALAFPPVLSCSFAFMLPAATAPNAIVKEASSLPASTMLAAGLGMNVICVLTTVAYFAFVVQNVYESVSSDPMPDWLANGTVEAFREC